MVVIWTERYSLRNSESRLLYLATTRLGGDLLARARRVSTETIKKQSAEICRKTGAPSLQGAALLLLRETLRAET